MTNATAEFPFGTISWNTELIIERIEGDNTATIWDDVYSLEGSSNGTNSYGTNYNVVTEVPLVKINETDCLRNFVSGVVVLNDSNNNEIRLDYDPIGGGQCDKTAELTINDGEPFIINLR
ncbi:MAG: hypothetical protein HKN22_06025 [Bacteroidia bacterium]|nr:hypothetical protein [Bacteroidia bacterium]